LRQVFLAITRVLAEKVFHTRHERIFVMQSPYKALFMAM